MVYWFEGKVVYGLPEYYLCPYNSWYWVPVWCGQYPNCEGCPIYEGSRYENYTG